MEIEKKDILNSKSLKVFIKRSILIIGLFVVLYCSIDTLVLLFGKNFGYDLNKMIIILVSPIIVFLIVLICFLCLINKMSYWFTGNKNDDIIFDTKKLDELINTIEKLLNTNSLKNNDTIKEKMLNLLIKSTGKYFNKILLRR